MAGYMTKLNGHVYDGAHVAAEKLTNGLFAEITTDGVKKITAVKDTVMRVAEKTTLWGKEALILDVVSVGADEVFFVENEWDVNEYADYDAAEFECAVGDYVKMHRPTVGEQLILTVDNALYTSANVGDSMKPTTDGTIAAA